MLKTSLRLDWIWNFLLSFFSPRIAADIGPLILLIFFGMLLFGAVFVYLFIPETKGLSLEEVRQILLAVELGLTLYSVAGRRDVPCTRPPMEIAQLASQREAHTPQGCT